MFDTIIQQFATIQISVTHKALRLQVNYYYLLLFWSIQGHSIDTFGLILLPNTVLEINGKKMVGHSVWTRHAWSGTCAKMLRQKNFFTLKHYHVSSCEFFKLGAHLVSWIVLQKACVCVCTEEEAHDLNTIINNWY